MTLLYSLKIQLAIVEGEWKWMSFKGWKSYREFVKLKGLGWFKYKSWKEQIILREKVKYWRFRIEDIEKENLKSREWKLEFEKKNTRRRNGGSG